MLFSLTFQKESSASKHPKPKAEVNGEEGKTKGRKRKRSKKGGVSEVSVGG